MAVHKFTLSLVINSTSKLLESPLFKLSPVSIPEAVHPPTLTVPKLTVTSVVGLSSLLFPTLKIELSPLELLTTPEHYWAQPAQWVASRSAEHCIDLIISRNSRSQRENTRYTNPDVA